MRLQYVSGCVYKLILHSSVYAEEQNDILTLLIMKKEGEVQTEADSLDWLLCK